MLKHMELFAGAGGGLLGAKLAGFETVCAVEINDFRRGIIQKRIDEGYLPRMTLKRRVESIDGDDWRGRIDIISGGFPCQDISAAGKGKGIEQGEKSGLWREYARILREIRPHFALVENSPRLTVKGLGTILADLAAMGYDAEWEVLSAMECGAPHLRRRMWILAVERRDMADRVRRRLAQSLEASRLKEQLADASRVGKQSAAPRRWKVEPRLGRMADGMANRVDRIKAIGAGQVPRVFNIAFWGLLGRYFGRENLLSQIAFAT